MIEYRGLDGTDLEDFKELGSRISKARHSGAMQKRAQKGFLGLLTRLVDTGKNLGAGSSALTGITLGIGAHTAKTMIKKKHRDENKLKSLTKIYEDAYERLIREPELW